MAQPRRAATLKFDTLETRDVPTAVWQADGFDVGEVVGAAPAGWVEWSSGKTAVGPFVVAADAARSGSAGLSSKDLGRVDSRAWQPTAVPTDYAVAASVRPDGAATAGVLARGVALNTAAPSFLSGTVSAGGKVEFYEIVNGRMNRFTTVFPIHPAPAGTWFRVSLTPTGDSTTVRIQRQDTNEYLDSWGNWQATPTDAVQIQLDGKPVAGNVGVIRPARGSGAAGIDDFAVTAPGILADSFDSLAAGTVPSGWQTWANQAAVAGGYGVSAGRFVSTGPSNSISRAWTADPLPADVRVAGSILADSLIPAGVIARGSALDTTRPSYYAAVMTRGLTVQLVKVVDGVSTVLGTIKSTAYTSGQWVRVMLSVEGNKLRVLVNRTDTQKWLSSSGAWQDTPDAALEVTDGSIAGIGLGGFLRTNGAAGPVSFDDFAATPTTGPGPVPRVTINPSTPQVGGAVTFTATTDDPTAVRRVEFILAGQVVSSSATVPAQWSLDTTMLANGGHDLTVRAVDAAGTTAETIVHFQVYNAAPNPARPPLPTIPRKYSHIRIAELAYSGNPMGATEQSLLQSSVDLVIPNAKYLATIDAASPTTPQLLYSNVTNLYQDLLADWLNYADRNRVSREKAFYHVTAATPFQGNSPSSQPVTYFWGVTRVTSAGGATDLTAAAEGGRTFGVEFGGSGTTLNVGYLEKYREINVTLNRPASAGWGGVWEYAAGTDAAGNVTAWKPLTLVSDWTNGMTQDGRITFDPPIAWVPGIVPGSTGRNYYVRFRATAGTTAQGPEAKTILGRDYVGANGRTTGTIPAFDYTADKDGDGYLNDAEYATRATGKDARFVYETRLFYPYYGQMRFVTDPSDPIVQRWAADFNKLLLAANPLADGVMLDNSLGKIAVDGIPLAESTATYGADLGRLIQSTWSVIAPKFVLANTAGGQAAADPVVAGSSAAFEEFMLRPTDATWSSVNDVAALVKRRLGAATPSPYLVIDSTPGSTSPTDPRTQIGTLAYYYLVADPEKTFLMFNGGYAPASSWTDHWTPAAAVDVGQPTAAMTTFASGTDPQNAALTYKVYGRTYGNALVLYKPRSYAPGKGTGTTADATATTHDLGGNYRPVNADGTLGPIVNQITLRNGEGAVLIKA